MAASGQRRLLSEMVAVARRLTGELAGQDFEGATPDTVAQAVACAAPILAAARIPLARVSSWLCEQLAPWERWALQQGTLVSTQYSGPSAQYEGPKGLSVSPSPAHLYDSFLRRFAPDRRKRGGVFFTPQPIADYIVRRIDAVLTEDFGQADGLADHFTFLLDPACGTGVFLLAVIGHLQRQLGENWSDVVPELLPRLIGIEILPAAAFLAKLNIALALAETGYDFRRPGRIEIHCGDALDPNLQLAICNSQFAIPVILGNPPYCCLSTNTNPWIARLVRGGDEVRGYVQANGQRLNERKTWLHDDYVKFLRLGQWHVEQAGYGIVGFVTNHSFLDNATFRLMRQELLRVFPRIEILDLHGSRKAHEVAPDGSRDENVFGLDQGLAIGLFSRPTPTQSASEGLSRSRVTYCELWGTRASKLDSLRDSPGASRAGVDSRVSPSLALRASVASPVPPDYCFTPAAQRSTCAQYAAAWSLADAMPVHATAPVTARDRFVVAFTAGELRRRIEEFCDLSIPDGEIRRRYFQRTRSARYETGDTRSWKLAAARRLVAADADWPGKIVPCLYRPFDWRYVFWHPAMIDWPRTEVTQHLLNGRTGTEAGQRDGETEGRSDSALRRSFTPSLRLALIARRQQLPSQPCTFFWIADGLALDGVIRSDNRGSESLFPLYLREERGWRANFAPSFVDEAQQSTELTWLPLGRGNLTQTFGPEDLLGYIYALFHAPGYRQSYAAELRRGFPRVLLPPGAEPFAAISRWGRELVDLHLLRGPEECHGRHFLNAAECHGGHSLQNAAQGGITSIPDEVASFRAGGYVALRKWLQPAQRSAADPDYSRIVAAIAGTLERMRQIDRALAQCASASQRTQRRAVR